jgi:hypothetical protein
MILKNYYELTKLTTEPILFAKAKASINYLNTKNTKKIPTKSTKTLVLLCDYLCERAHFKFTRFYCLTLALSKGEGCR